MAFPGTTKRPLPKRDTVNAFTVDVEEFFQVSAFEQHVARDDWACLPGRVERNMGRLFEILEEGEVKATFFALGWIAERHPDLIKKIVANGHELASHGVAHVRVNTQSRSAFREDVRRSKEILEEISGVRVVGYRAASYSIDRSCRWAHEELGEAGYLYSSSIYPIRHDLYGEPGAPRFTYLPIADDTGFIEVPITTVEVLGRRLPCGGGGYFRLYPYRLSRWAIQQVNKRDGQAAVFYCHPWEIDPAQPRPKGLPLKTRFRHYLNLGKMESRLVRLLSDFAWDRMDRVFLPHDADCVHSSPSRARQDLSLTSVNAADVPR